MTLVEKFPHPAYRFVFPHRIQQQAQRARKAHLSGSPDVKDSDVSLSHYFDVELGVKEEGEPDPAPLKSYEQIWMRLKRQYREDCREHEHDHGMGKSQSVSSLVYFPSGTS